MSISKKYGPIKNEFHMISITESKMQILWCKGFYTSQCQVARMHEHRHICEKPKWMAPRTSKLEIQYHIVVGREGMEVETRVGITIRKVDMKRGVRIN